jgi:uncharacterized protein
MKQVDTVIERFEQEINNRKVVGTLFNSKITEEKISSLVVLLHGFLASKEDLYFIAENLTKKGLDVLCLDLYAHGETEGNFNELTISKCVNDLHEIISSFREMKSYSKYSLLGYSIGGYVALSYCSKYNDINSIVLCAPVSDFKNLFKSADLKEWKNNNMLKDGNLSLNINLNYEFYKDGIEIFNYKKAKKMNVKILILHGSNDSVVPLEQSNNLTNALPHSILHIISSAEHDNLFSIDKNVMNLISEFIKN